MHEKTGRVVVAHRGTVGTAQDWFNNAVYGAFGDKGYELTGRFKKAKKTQKKAEKKYGAENISTIGHSQGGLLAQKVGGDSKEIITLNKATRPQDFFKQKRSENQTDIRTEGDVVSMFKNPYETQGEQVTIKTDKFNPLAEHATDVLDRMKADKAADQPPLWSTSGRPPGTMISRVGRLISKSFFGRGPGNIEEIYGGANHDAGPYDFEESVRENDPLTTIEAINDPSDAYLDDLAFLTEQEMAQTVYPRILRRRNDDVPVQTEEDIDRSLSRLPANLRNQIIDVERETQIQEAADFFDEHFVDTNEQVQDERQNRLRPSAPRTSRMERQRRLLARLRATRAIREDMESRIDARRRLYSRDDEDSVMGLPMRDEAPNRIRSERTRRRMRRLRDVPFRERSYEREQIRRQEQAAQRRAALEGRRFRFPRTQAMRNFPSHPIFEDGGEEIGVDPQDQHHMYYVGRPQESNPDFYDIPRLS